MHAPLHPHACICPNTPTPLSFNRYASVVHASASVETLVAEHDLALQHMHLLQALDEAQQAAPGPGPSAAVAVPAPGTAGSAGPLHSPLHHATAGPAAATATWPKGSGLVRDDLVVAMCCHTNRLDVAQASRVWRQGMRALIAVNESSVLQLAKLNRHGRAHNETYTFYADEEEGWRGIGRWRSDVRCALSAFEAHRVFGSTYRQAGSSAHGQAVAHAGRQAGPGLGVGRAG